ncbi:unnamed protein product [Closterium sp. NIES-54]
MPRLSRPHPTPPHLTPHHRNEQIPDEQSLVGRRRLYYDAEKEETTVCSESEDEGQPSSSQLKDFSAVQDALIWRTIQQHGDSGIVIEHLASSLNAQAEQVHMRHTELKAQCQEIQGFLEKEKKKDGVSEKEKRESERERVQEAAEPRGAPGESAAGRATAGATTAGVQIAEARAAEARAAEAQVGAADAGTGAGGAALRGAPGASAAGGATTAGVQSAEARAAEARAADAQVGTADAGTGAGGAAVAEAAAADAAAGEMSAATRTGAAETAGAGAAAGAAETAGAGAGAALDCERGSMGMEVIWRSLETVQFPLATPPHAACWWQQGHIHSDALRQEQEQEQQREAPEQQQSMRQQQATRQQHLSVQQRLSRQQGTQQQGTQQQGTQQQGTQQQGTQQQGTQQQGTQQQGTQQQESTAGEARPRGGEQQSNDPMSVEGREGSSRMQVDGEKGACPMQVDGDEGSTPDAVGRPVLLAAVKRLSIAAAGTDEPAEAAAASAGAAGVATLFAAANDTSACGASDSAVAAASENVGTASVVPATCAAATAGAASDAGATAGAASDAGAAAVIGQDARMACLNASAAGAPPPAETAGPIATVIPASAAAAAAASPSEPSGSGSGGVCEETRQVLLGQFEDLEGAMDSWDHLFCRRCLIFDCKTHGTVDEPVVPSDQQPPVESTDVGKSPMPAGPCGPLCFMNVRALVALKLTRMQAAEEKAAKTKAKGKKKGKQIVGLVKLEDEEEEAEELEEEEEEEVELSDSVAGEESEEEEEEEEGGEENAEEEEETMEEEVEEVEKERGKEGKSVKEEEMGEEEEEEQEEGKEGRLYTGEGAGEGSSQGVGRGGKKGSRGRGTSRGRARAGRGGSGRGRGVRWREGEGGERRRGKGEKEEPERGRGKGEKEEGEKGKREREGSPSVLEISSEEEGDASDGEACKGDVAEGGDVRMTADVEGDGDRGCEQENGEEKKAIEGKEGVRNLEEGEDMKEGGEVMEEEEGREGMEGTQGKDGRSKEKQQQQQEEQKKEQQCDQQEWSALERELLSKGVRIFGASSCVLARTVLAHLKTCSQIAICLLGQEGGDMHEETPTPLGRHRRRTSKARRRLVQAQWGYNKGRRKGGAGQPVVVQRLKAEASKERQYEPCSCKGPCTKATCECIMRGCFCEKYCGCAQACKNRFRGCNCAKSHCSSRLCPCFAASRECDPDLCRNCWVDCGDSREGAVLPLPPPVREKNYDCHNMRLLLRQHQHILLGPSDVAGWGAFLKKEVAKNDYVGEYTGELISEAEAERRGKIYDRINCSFLFDLNKKINVESLYGQGKGNQQKLHIKEMLMGKKGNSGVANCDVGGGVEHSSALQLVSASRETSSWLRLPHSQSHRCRRQKAGSHAVAVIGTRMGATHPCGLSARISAASRRSAMVPAIGARTRLPPRSPSTHPPRIFFPASAHASARASAATPFTSIMSAILLSSLLFAALLVTPAVAQGSDATSPGCTVSASAVSCPAGLGGRAFALNAQAYVAGAGRENALVLGAGGTADKGSAGSAFTTTALSPPLGGGGSFSARFTFQLEGQNEADVATGLAFRSPCGFPCAHPCPPLCARPCVPPCAPPCVPPCLPPCAPPCAPPCSPRALSRALHRALPHALPPRATFPPTAVLLPPHSSAGYGGAAFDASLAVVLSGRPPISAGVLLGGKADGTAGWAALNPSSPDAPHLLVPGVQQHAWVDYDASSSSLSLFLSGSSPTKPAAPVLSEPVDLARTLGLAADGSCPDGIGEAVVGGGGCLFVGFTGGSEAVDRTELAAAGVVAGGELIQTVDSFDFKFLSAGATAGATADTTTAATVDASSTASRLPHSADISSATVASFGATDPSAAGGGLFSVASVDSGSGTGGLTASAAPAPAPSASSSPAPCNVTATSISCIGFSSSSSASPGLSSPFFVLSGDAQVGPGPNFPIWLDTTTNAAGCAFSIPSLSLSLGSGPVAFEAAFSFSFAASADYNSWGSRGLAFVLTAGEKTACGRSSGSNIGYGSAPNASFAKSIAVELRARPAACVAVVVGGQVAGDNCADSDAMALLPPSQAFTLNEPQHVWVSYDGSSGALQVFVSPGAATKPSAPVLVAPIDVAAVLGGTSGLSIGFTGASWWTWVDDLEDHIIHSLSFQAVPPGSQQSLPPSPAPTTCHLAPSHTRLTCSGFAGRSAFRLNGYAHVGPAPSFPLVLDTGGTAGSALTLADLALSLDSSTSAVTAGGDPAAAAAAVAFEAAFAFSVWTETSYGYRGSRGLTFVVSSGDKTACGSSDMGAIGYGGAAPGAFNGSVAVELRSGPSSCVAVVVNGVASGDNCAAADHMTGLTGDQEIALSERQHAWVAYDGTSQSLEVYLGGSDGIKPEEPVLRASLDLVAVIGATSASVGFTAGTWWWGCGDTDDHHLIHSFTFNTVSPGFLPAAQPTQAPTCETTASSLHCTGFAGSTPFDLNGYAQLGPAPLFPLWLDSYDSVGSALSLAPLSLLTASARSSAFEAAFSFTFLADACAAIPVTGRGFTFVLTSGPATAVGPQNARCCAVLGAAGWCLPVLTGSKLCRGVLGGAGWCWLERPGDQETTLSLIYVSLPLLFPPSLPPSLPPPSLPPSLPLSLSPHLPASLPSHQAFPLNTQQFAWVNYEGASQTLNVFLGGSSKVKPGVPTLTAHVDIETLLGATSASVGFTGGTWWGQDMASERHIIHQLSFVGGTFLETTNVTAELTSAFAYSNETDLSLFTTTAPTTTPTATTSLSSTDALATTGTTGGAAVLSELSPDATRGTVEFRFTAATASGPQSFVGRRRIVASRPVVSEYGRADR